MVDFSGVAVAQGAQQLKCEPFLLNVFEEGSGAETVVEGGIEELADEVSVRFGFDNALEGEGVGDIGECLALVLESSAYVIYVSITGCPYL